jgi:hypothetical protein
MKLAKSIASIAIIACAAHASAESLSSATVSNVTFTLIDLDLSDGIAPSITFNPASNYNALVGTSLYEFYTNAPNWTSGTYQLASSKFGPESTSGVGMFTRANAGVIGDGTLGGTVLQASGASTSTPFVESAYFAGAGILRDTSNAYSADAFSLSAHTRVIFSADVDLFAHIANEPPAPTSPYRLAVAYSQLLVFEADVGSSPGSQLDIVEVRAEENSDSYLPGAGTRIQQTSTVQFENLTSDWLTGAVGISANVHGQSRYALAVPEPASALSLSCGLALMGWRCRSRRTLSIARLA